MTKKDKNINSKKNEFISPRVSPLKKNGEKLSTKIILNTGYTRTDGTCAIYLYIYLKKKKKRIPLNINVLPEHFSKKKQRVKSIHPQHQDYNLLIEKNLSEIHNIELDFRLRNQSFDLYTIVKEFYNPSPKIDFLKFYESELKKEKGLIRNSTYKQQMSTLSKLKKWKSTILFQKIDSDFIKDLTRYCKVSLKNEDATIYTLLKNVKKFLNKAKEKGIYFPLKTKEIKILTPQSRRTFLSESELKKLYNFYNSNFINSSYKNVLRLFLFSCFTGLRFKDVISLKQTNISENTLFFTAEKTNKIQRIRLNKTALSFLIKHKTEIFPAIYTNEYVNRELKDIAKITGITKKLTFHVARHTFATQFLIKGGSVENLQHILAHGNIRETMIYVHIVDSVTDMQIFLLDDLFNLE